MQKDRALRIHHDASGYRALIETLARPAPNPGEVLVRVEYSSINYKDALAGTGRGKIMTHFPLVGGIDAAGVVEASGDPAFKPGDPVIATGYGLGVDHDGGYAQWLCVPAAWLVPMPRGLDTRSAMILGTAGFTAALALHRMQINGQSPSLGPILITGAGGGVGSIAVAIFSRLGYEVVAMSGTPELEGWLKTLGAQQVIGRDALAEAKRPLEKARWGGAIDNVGGDILAQITRTLRPHGNIASIGLAASPQLHTTVMPFILRGISLLGCDSSSIGQPLRAQLWEHLSSDWRPIDLDALIGAQLELADLPSAFERLLDGQTHGRLLVRI